MQPIKILNIKKAVSKIKYIGDDQICIVEEDNTVRIYDINTFKLINGFKLKLHKNNPKENSVDVSRKGSFIAIGVKGENKTKVWSLKKKKLIYTLGWHKGDVLSVTFDNEENYLMTGGEDGRTYIWSLRTGKMISSLTPHPDYVVSTAFSKNSLWGSTGSYDKSVTITNISSMNISYRKKTHKNAVTFLKFLDKQKMISGDKSGELAIWEYTKGSIYKRLPSMIDGILDIAVTQDEKFMFAISEKNKNISLYLLENYELVNTDFITLSSQPFTIEYIPEYNYLIIGTENKVYIYSLFEGKKEFIYFVQNNQYEKAYELINKNPFLKNLKEYESLEERWNKLLMLSQKKFEQGEIDIAKQLIAPFLKIPSKRNIVQSMYNDFGEFEKFKKTVLTQKYPLAYSLITKYPNLKNTVYYKKVENDWNKILEQAKKLISKNRDKEAIELLKPFRNIMEKNIIIQALFNERQLYRNFAQKLSKKEFKDFFIMVNKYPFLEETKEYHKAVRMGELFMERAYESLEKKAYSQAMHLFKILKQFPMLQKEAEEMYIYTKALLEFNKILEKKDINEIERYVKNHPFLEETEEYQNIEKQYLKDFQECEILAAKGKVKEILEKLSFYLNAEDKQIKIGQLIKSAYLQQIIYLLTKKEQNIQEYFEKAVLNYIKIFGFDNEIFDLIQKAQQLNIEVKPANISEGNISQWHLHKLPSKIWEKIE